MAYPNQFWAELWRSTSFSSLNENAGGEFVWLVTSDGLPLEQQIFIGSWLAVGSDTEEPDYVNRAVNRNAYRFRKTGEDWIPSAAGISFATVPWGGQSRYRFFEQPGLEGAVTTGIPTVSGRLAAAQLAGGVSTGVPDAAALLEAAQLAGAVLAGEPAAQANLKVAQLAGHVNAGIPTVTGDLDTKTLRGRVFTGVPTVQGNMQHGLRLIGEVSAGIAAAAADLAPAQLAGEIAAQAPAVTADLAPAQLAGRITAEEAAVVGKMAPGPLRANVSAGVPSVEGASLRAPQLRGAVSTGTPVARADLARALELKGRVSAGVPTVSGTLGLGTLIVDTGDMPITPSGEGVVAGYEDLPLLEFERIFGSMVNEDDDARRMMP